MTIDEAIEHAKEVARTCDDSQCAADHMQLAEWLRQARGAEKAARWYTSRIHDLNGEIMCLSMQNQGLKLCYDRARAEYKSLEAENAKLLELVGTDIVQENNELRRRVHELEICVRGDAACIRKIVATAAREDADRILASINRRLEELGLDASHEHD